MARTEPSHNPRSRSLPLEAENLARAKKGDKEAYRYLVEGYQDRLFTMVVSMVSNREQAEDLVQEIFIKAYFALPSFEGGSSFYTWLYRIASNHCLDHFKKRKLDQISLDRPLTEDSEATFQNSFEAPRMERPDTRYEGPAQAQALLSVLKPEERLVLTLRELEGYAYEEIAEMLKCPVNTIKSRLNRAREALKIAYENLYGEGNISQRKIVENSGEIS